MIDKKIGIYTLGVGTGFSQGCSRLFRASELADQIRAKLDGVIELWVSEIPKDCF